MSDTPTVENATTLILRFEKDLNDCAVIEPDGDERRLMRAASSALGRVRRAHRPRGATTSPTEAASPQGGGL
jgi:hypothetical protein